MTKKRQPDGCQKAASAALQSVSEIRHDESSSGDGRSRTAVQTTPQRAFYTLIPPLVVDLGLPKDGPAGAYPLNLGGP